MPRYEVTGTYGDVPIKPMGLDAESIEDARVRAEAKGIRLKSIRPLEDTGESAWSPGPPPLPEDGGRGRSWIAKAKDRMASGDDGASLTGNEPSTFVTRGRPVPLPPPEPRSMEEMMADLVALQQKANQLLDHGLRTRARQYRVEIVVEGVIGTLLLGASKLSPAKLEKVMNRLSSEGWEFEFMAIESRRMLLFWQREAVILTFSRPTE